MRSLLISAFLTFRGLIRSRIALHLEVLALRHQLQVLQRSQPHRLALGKVDRCLWVWLSRVWVNWRTALVIVQPETVIAWHRRGFRLFWAWKSRRRIGRPCAYQKLDLVESRGGDGPLEDRAVRLNRVALVSIFGKMRSVVHGPAIIGCLGERRFGLVGELGRLGQAACRSYR